MPEPEFQEFEFGYSDPLGQYTGASIVARRWQYLPTAEQPRFEGSRMRIEVIEASGITSNLFVWERHTVYEDGSAENKDRVMCVAKVGDLSVYPVGAPDLDSDIPPFYRLSTFDLPFSSPTDMIDTWDQISRSINELLKSYVELGLTDA